MLRSISFTAFAAFATATTAMELPADHWKFRALLDGSEIGFQRFDLQNGGGALQVNSEAQFDVRFLFINVYRYRHRHTERWQDGCLGEIRAQTDDNGKQFDLLGTLQNDRFVLNVNGVEQNLPACIKTFAYWNPSLVAQPQINLLNPQDGRFLNAEVEFIREETLPLLGQQIPARRYRLRAEELDIELWYARDDRRWLRLESQVGGSRLIYELVN